MSEMIVLLIEAVAEPKPFQTPPPLAKRPTALLNAIVLLLMFRVVTPSGPGSLLIPPPDAPILPLTVLFVTFSVADRWAASLQLKILPPSPKLARLVAIGLSMTVRVGPREDARLAMPPTVWRWLSVDGFTPVPPQLLAINSYSYLIEAAAYPLRNNVCSPLIRQREVDGFLTDQARKFRR